MMKKMGKDNMISKMLRHSEVGDAKGKVKGQARKGNRMGKQLKAKRGRYSTAQL